MSTLKGPVRFRFRQPESDVDVMIQGDAEWVRALREDLGLGDVGWIQPMATTGHSVQVSQSDEESLEDGEMTDDESPVILQSDTTSSLPGPPPDPSRIPVVRRVIGDMDLDAEMEKLGIEHPVLQPPKNCQI